MTGRSMRSAWRAGPGLPAALPACLAAFTAAVVLCAASPVWSFIPKGERIAKATAEANRAGARTQALSLRVTLRIADREPVATGSLVTHPNGLARLELRDGMHRVERHLLQGTEHTASRDGEELDAPRKFLAPLFLLQAGSELTLEQALSDYGMDIEALALAPCGARTCYVIGDAARVPPSPPPGDDKLAEMRARELAHPAVSGPRVDAAGPAHATDALDGLATATIWIDTESFQITRIESRSGVVVVLGPYVAWGDVLFPVSITIEEPGQEPARFDVKSVVPVNAPAAEFGREWLLTPAAELSATPPPSR